MKTIKANNIAVLIGLIIVCLNTHAQPPTGKKAICDELMKNPYIFEGKIISSKHYYTIKTGEYTYENYNSYLVQITKVLRGNIQKGTINLLQPTIGYTYKGPDHWEGGMQPSDGELPNAPIEGLYFCYAQTSMKDSIYQSTNTIAVEYYCGESMSNGELKKDDNDNLIGYFPSITDFYAYIKANYGIDVSTK